MIIAFLTLAAALTLVELASLPPRGEDLLPNDDWENYKSQFSKRYDGMKINFNLFTRLYRSGH